MVFKFSAPVNDFSTTVLILISLSKQRSWPHNLEEVRGGIRAYAWVEPKIPKLQSLVANFATTATDGKTYQVAHFNLDVIISVGYRVKSISGTDFRIWATGFETSAPRRKSSFGSSLIS